MKKRFLINLTAAFMVFGLVFTVSCAKKQVVSEPTGMSSDSADADAAARAEELARQRAMEEARLAEEAARNKSLTEAEYAQKMASEQSFQSQDVNFDFDSFELSSVAKTILKDKALWLEENANAHVLIEGHCDDRGTTEYNIALGERRAIAAQKYLINLGISESRLSTISYGEERPLDSAATEDAWAKNRRAHFVVK